MIKANNSRGHDMAHEGDGIDLAYPDSTERRGRVQKESCSTLQCSDTLGVVVKPLCYRAMSPSDSFRGSPEGDHDDPAPTCKVKSLPNGVVIQERERVVIRKLTEREYWRLMGFSDGDFDRAAQVSSRSQLYKQAGNSIAVPVLEAIFTELYTKKQPTVRQLADYDEGVK